MSRARQPLLQKDKEEEAIRNKAAADKKAAQEAQEKNTIQNLEDKVATAVRNQESTQFQIAHMDDNFRDPVLKDISSTSLFAFDKSVIQLNLKRLNDTSLASYIKQLNTAIESDSEANTLLTEAWKLNLKGKDKLHTFDQKLKKNATQLKELHTKFLSSLQRIAKTLKDEEFKLRGQGDKTSYPDTLKSMTANLQKEIDNFPKLKQAVEEKAAVQVKTTEEKSSEAQKKFDEKQKEFHFQTMQESVQKVTQLREQFAKDLHSVTAKYNNQLLTKTELEALGELRDLPKILTKRKVELDHLTKVQACTRDWAEIYKEDSKFKTLITATQTNQTELEKLHTSFMTYLSNTEKTLQAEKTLLRNKKANHFHNYADYLEIIIKELQELSNTIQLEEKLSSASNKIKELSEHFKALKKEHKTTEKSPVKSQEFLTNLEKLKKKFEAYDKLNASVNILANQIANPKQVTLPPLLKSVEKHNNQFETLRQDWETFLKTTELSDKEKQKEEKQATAQVTQKQVSTPTSTTASSEPTRPKP